ncbi:phosphoribosylamine--glycine ligase [archaeon]|nr:phosphoribosylamine--glycine ligase [archaeon]
MKNAKVLIIGAGGREHTLADAYLKSKHVGRVIIAPGNDFIPYSLKERYPDKKIIIEKDCNLKDPDSLLDIAEFYTSDLIDVAQDDALASGLVDTLKEQGYNVFGPTKEASNIESDKIWSRLFMERHSIPSPSFGFFDNTAKAEEYVRNIYSEEPDSLLYIKASGLCGGKGAIRAENIDETYAAIDLMKTFGESGESFVIEEGLIGEEFSVFAISDGNNYKIINTAQDNKTLYDDDKGPNTGGMGAHSPALVTEDIRYKIDEELIAPVIKGMAEEGVPFKGILYLGGMLTDSGLKVIEYNARWGDPEAQAILPGLQCDYYELIQACIKGDLKNFNLKTDDKTRVCIIGAAKGYPDNPIKGCEITGLDEVMETDGVKVYGAGIKVKDGKLYTSGGRVFNIVAEGQDIVTARKKGYPLMGMVTIEGNNLHYRTDIGIKDEKRY